MGFGSRLLNARGSTRTLAGVPLLAMAVLAGMAVPAGAAPAAPAQPATRPVQSGVQVVTLITGDTVAVRTDAQGRQNVVTRPAEGRGSFSTVRQNGDLYVFPAAAMPYLGVSLDRSLFDVSALIRDGAASRVPVRVSFAAGAAQQAPGLTVTGSPNATTRDGYVAAADAAAFGSALSTQSRHDIRAGMPAGRQLFGGVTAVRYAGRGPGPVVQPNFPMFTVRINALGLAGEPLEFGFLDVINIDDARKFTGFPIVVNGEARISVPAGHYTSLLASFSLDENDNFITHDVITEFEVTGAGSVTVDARRATARPTFTTPRPALADSYGYVWQRLDATGSGGIEFSSAGTTPPFISPVPAPTIGVQHYVAEASFSSPAGTEQTYGFDLRGRPSTDIPAVQNNVVTPASLATVRETYATDREQEGAIARFSFESWQLSASAFVPPRPFPSRNTQYVSARPDLLHQQWVLATALFDSFGSFMSNGLRSYSPRQQVSEEWFRAPVKPGFPADPATSNFSFCNACRSGDELLISVQPETDSTPDHSGFLDFPQDGVTSTSRFQLLSGDTVLADRVDSTGGIIPVPAGDAPYKIVYDQTRIAPWFTTAPVSHTEWTFRSATSTARTVPDHVICFTDETCSGVSLLDTTYHLNGSLLNTMRPGVATMDLTIRHSPYTPDLPARKVTVSLSFNGGRSFVPALVVPLGHNRFKVAWLNPRQSGPVTLKVGAADSAGNTIAQTIQGAYTIAGGSGA
jgi:hypothetical protein